MTHITTVSVDIPNVDELWCINCKISPLELQDPLIKSLFHAQILTCRLIIYSVKCCIASPSIQNVADIIHVIVGKKFFSTGKLQEHLASLKIEFFNPDPVHPKIYEACLKYTFTFKLAPFWNSVGRSYYLHGTHFLSRTETCHEALEWNIQYNAGSSKIMLKPMKLSLSNFDIHSLVLSSPAVMNRFISQRLINSLQLEFESIEVYVLPKLTKARIVSVSKTIPESSPFNNYNDLRRHWKNMYSFRLPKTDQGMYYYEVVFPRNPHQKFTYPELCLFSKLPKVLMCENLNETAMEFIKDLTTNVKSVCGKPLSVGRLLSEPVLAKFTKATELKRGSMSNTQELTSTFLSRDKVNLSALLPSQKMNQLRLQNNVRSQRALPVLESAKEKSFPSSNKNIHHKPLQLTDNSYRTRWESEIDDEIILDRNVDRRFPDDIENLDEVISYYDLPSMWVETAEEFNNASSDAAIVKDCENYKRFLQKDSLKQLLSFKSSNGPAIKKIEKVQYDLTQLKKKQNLKQTDNPITKFEEKYGKKISPSSSPSSQYFHDQKEQLTETRLSPDLELQNLCNSSNSLHDKNTQSRSKKSCEEWKTDELNKIFEKNGIDLKRFYDSPFVKSIISSHETDNYHQNIDHFQQQEFPKKDPVQKENGTELTSSSTTNQVHNPSKVPLSDHTSQNSHSSLKKINQCLNFQSKNTISNFSDNFSLIDSNIPIKTVQKNRVNTEQMDKSTTASEFGGYKKMLVDDLNVSDYCNQSVFSNFSTVSNNNDNLRKTQTQKSQILNNDLQSNLKDHLPPVVSKVETNNIDMGDVEMNEENTSSSSETTEKLSEKRLFTDQVEKCFQKPSFDVRNFYNSPFVQSIIDEQKTLKNSEKVSNYLKFGSLKDGLPFKENKIRSSVELSKDRKCSQTKVSPGEASKSSRKSPIKLKINQNIGSENSLGNLNSFNKLPLSTNSSKNFESLINRKMMQPRKSPDCVSSSLNEEIVQESRNLLDGSFLSTDYSDKFNNSLNRMLLQPRKSPVQKSDSPINEVKNTQDSKKKFKKNFEEEISFSNCKTDSCKKENFIDDVHMEDVSSQFSSPDIFESYEKQNSFSLLEKHCKSDFFAESNVVKNSEEPAFETKSKSQKEKIDFMSVISESSEESDTN